ncbi:MAG: DUF4031 domain-containing protein [Neptunomonas phycophila]|uniref:DUF4031 domain-containing protein n=1 Tax=Neptunomonas phycophila TaxID=1572645 RepID=UPI003B8CFE71
MEYYCDSKRHLVCVPYSIENLHKMADDLGIKRCWFHSSKHPHYDIPKKRIKEIQARCILISPKELLNIIKGKGGQNETKTNAKNIKA